MAGLVVLWTLVARGNVAAGTDIDELDDVRRAKIGLAWFVLDHLDRPTRIVEPCPAMSQESMSTRLSALGLVPSLRLYGPAVVVEEEVGAGVAMLRCGNDLALSPDPANATSVSFDVFMLDGQATFDQYAVVIAGTDVLIEQSEGPAGETAGRCRNGGSRCTWALNVEGLVVTVRTVGLPPESGEPLTREMLAQVTPEIITNLAASMSA